MAKQVKTYLDDELEEKFEKIKYKMGLTVDAEVVRQTINLRYRQMFQEEGGP